VIGWQPAVTWICSATSFVFVFKWMIYDARVTPSHREL